MTSPKIAYTYPPMFKMGDAMPGPHSAPVKHSHYRHDIINHIIAKRFNGNCRYLEIGVSDPSQCFDKINSLYKISVDPGVEFEPNPVMYKMTSDVFFSKLPANTEFDVIFLDGLHLAEQTWTDIQNALKVLSPNGYVVLHDCSPASEERTTEDYEAYLRQRFPWNGTVWKAFYRFRHEVRRRGMFHQQSLDETYASVCVDTDEGIGIISKAKYVACIKHVNPMYSFMDMDSDRQYQLGLMSVQDFMDYFDTGQI